MSKRCVLSMTLASAVALGAWSSAEPLWAFDLPGPMKGVATGLTEEGKKVAIKKVEEAAEEMKRKLREEAHAQLEAQIKKVDDELKKKVAEIMKS